WRRDRYGAPRLFSMDRVAKRRNPGKAVWKRQRFFRGICARIHSTAVWSQFAGADSTRPLFFPAGALCAPRTRLRLTRRGGFGKGQPVSIGRGMFSRQACLEDVSGEDNCPKMI